MNKHISNIHIEKFRGLRDLQFNQLGQVNLFVGKNNSGKTSVLEAIELYARPLDPMEWLIVATRREGHSARILISETLRWLFPQTAQEPPSLYSGEILISGQGSYPVRQAQAKYTEFLGLGEILEEEESPNIAESKQLGAKLELKVTYQQETPALFDQEPLEEKAKNFILWQGGRFSTYRKPEGPLLPVVMLTSSSHLVKPQQVRYVSQVTLDEEVQDILEILCLIDANVKDIDILSPDGLRPSLYLKHNGVGFAPLSTFGDGIKRILTLAQALVKAENGILLVDEIETSIHTTALADMFAWLVAGCRLLNIQLFATTHNLEAVDAILAADIENTTERVIYRLNGPSQPTQRFGGAQLQRIRYQHGLDVR